MISNCLRDIMGHTITSRNFTLVLIAFLLHLLQSGGSPLHKAMGGSQNGGCPTGWLHYQRFCVTRGQGNSERAVALYCDAFGGIGIKGVCIIKAPDVDEEKSDDHSMTSEEIQAPSETIDHDLSRLKDDESDPDDVAQDSDQLTSGSKSEFEDRGVLVDNAIDGLVCSEGWIHYKNMCVYQPVSIKEECHRMGAVEFNGICLKHAKMGRLQPANRMYSRTDKRICCCAHIKAKSNRYGC